jgi:hypothetical protein
MWLLLAAYKYTPAVLLAPSTQLYQLILRCISSVHQKERTFWAGLFKLSALLQHMQRLCMDVYTHNRLVHSAKPLLRRFEFHHLLKHYLR